MPTPNNSSGRTLRIDAWQSGGKSGNVPIFSRTTSFNADMAARANFIFDAMAAEMSGVMEEISTNIINLYKQTVSTWNTPIEFIAEVERTVIKESEGEWKLSIVPSDVLYDWVNFGTASREITAVNVPMLRFLRNYTPRTSPMGNSLTSGQSVRFGNWVTKFSVVRSTAPRKFSEQIMEKVRPNIPAIITKRMKVILAREAGRLGGKATVAKYGQDYMSSIGKKGAAAIKARRKTK